MSARKRGRHRSPRRSSSLGLFFVLIVAVAAGVCAGSFLGRQSTPPYVPMGASGASPTPGSTPSTQPPPRPLTPPRERQAPNRRASDRTTVREQAKAQTAPSSDQPQPAQAPLPAKPRVDTPAGQASELVRATASTEVALTFDAGAAADPTPAVLNALKAAGLHVTFFLTGKWAEQNPSLVRQILAEGHEIGNHTYSHPDLRKLTDDQITEQLVKAEEIITRVGGEKPKPFFRPPFGGRDKRVLRVAAQAGYSGVYWSLDSWDSYKKGITSREITQRVLGRIKGGDIVLMHCGSMATAQALPGLIDELQKRGYRIVTVSELTGG